MICRNPCKAVAASAASRPRLTRRQLLTQAYASNTASGVRCITPSSSLHDAEQAIKTLGQAYIGHRWCQELQIRMGKEQDLFQGLARLQLDTLSHESVLLLTGDCDAAGILVDSTQELQVVTALQQLDFSVIAGTLQIMQAMPEGRLPMLTRELQQLQEAAVQAAKALGRSSYLKVLCLGVRPEVQCKGLGRALIASAMDRAQQEQQLLLVDVADAELVGMFERHGFKPVGSCGLFATLALNPL